MTIKPQRVQIGGGGNSIKCNTCGEELPANTNPCTTCARDPNAPADPSYVPSAPTSIPTTRSSVPCGPRTLVAILVVGVIAVSAFLTNGFGLFSGSASPTPEQPTAISAEQSTALPAATAEPTAAPSATAEPEPTSAPEPTSTPSPVPAATVPVTKGLVLIQTGVFTDDGTMSAAGWKIQYFGDSSNVALYDSVVEAAKTNQVLIVVTNGRDNASQIQLKPAIDELLSLGVRPIIIVLTERGNKSNVEYYAIALGNESGGASFTAYDPSEVKRWLSYLNSAQ